MNATNADVKNRFNELYDELFRHDGYGSIEVELKILRRGQKEVIIRCGKEYRFVIDFPEGRRNSAAAGAAQALQSSPPATVGNGRR
jgi:hypothetical protein